jgi:hypothetical protein
LVYRRVNASNPDNNPQATTKNSRAKNRDAVRSFPTKRVHFSVPCSATIAPSAMVVGVESKL